MLFTIRLLLPFLNEIWSRVLSSIFVMANVQYWFCNGTDPLKCFNIYFQTKKKPNSFNSSLNKLTLSATCSKRCSCWTVQNLLVLGCRHTAWPNNCTRLHVLFKNGTLEPFHGCPDYKSAPLAVQHKSLAPFANAGADEGNIGSTQLWPRAA